MDGFIRTAAEQAASQVVEVVYAAAREAAERAVADAIEAALGVRVEGVDVEDRVTRTEAARRLGVSPQKRIRLAERGAVAEERVAGRVYVRLSEIRAALGRPS